MQVYTLHFSTIDSTQTFAKNHFREFQTTQLTCITADVQTGGYGRFSRNWVSKKGNLHMSLAFSLQKSDPRILQLAQLLTYSVFQFFLKIHLSPEIKWPNDLLIEKKKISGVLVETIFFEKSIGIVMGLGMNVNALVQTDQPTISLKELTKQTWDLNTIRDQIISYFLTALNLGFSAIQEHFEKFLAYKGTEIICQVGNTQIQGILLGITKKGQLLLKKSKGTICEIYSGDIQQLRQL